MKPKLYIDIDGVLLGKNSPGDFEICLAKHAEEFLTLAVKHFNCYWLTTHCKDGNRNTAVDRLKPYVDEYILELAKSIKATQWKTLKTEAVDFSANFLWVEDSLLAIEAKELEQRGYLDRWLKIDTRKKPLDLMVAISKLREIVEIKENSSCLSE